jgi:aspartyl-tRNA(Asn)/glutamyl-tRNA(Gln) amidotransferase subunit C
MDKVTDKITPEIVKKAAGLSRLHFSEEETMIYTEQLNSILGYMEKLNELDTNDIEPTVNPNQNDNIMRNDILARGLNLDEILSNAAESEEGYFQVPQTI